MVRTKIGIFRFVLNWAFISFYFSNKLHFNQNKIILNNTTLPKFEKKSQGTFIVPKLTLGPFLTPCVRNGYKLKDWGFRIPAYIESKSR